MHHDADSVRRIPSVAYLFPISIKCISIIIFQLLMIYGETVHANGFPSNGSELKGKALWNQAVTPGQTDQALHKMSNGENKSFAQVPLPVDRVTHKFPAANMVDTGEALRASTPLADNPTPELVPFADMSLDKKAAYTAVNLTECTESSPAVGDDPRLVADCTTLLKSRDIIDPTGNQLNWSIDLVLTNWDGVRISSSKGRVIQLNLSSKENLSGSIPSELGNLTELTYLSFYKNNLTGPIPAELGNLTELTVLDLRYNNLSGSIPNELGNLTNLVQLELRRNGLTGSIPTELGNLTKLTTLDLWENNLVGSIPTEIKNLTNLNKLDLSHNNLTGSIPTEFEKLINIRYLDLSINDLTGSIPPELAKLTNLRILWLGNNPLTGSIPPEFGNLANMEQLSFANSNLTGSVPAELGNLSRMQVLYVSNNALTGSIPIELGNLNNLSNLTLDGNNLAGPIPAELGKATSLERLYLSQNNLSGPIPAELGNLARLKRLRLYGNNLTGCIPKNVNRLGSGMGSEYLPNPQRGGILPICEHETCIASTPAVGGDSRLVEACTTLLKVKEALDPPGSQLNWAYDRLMTDWKGVEISGGQVVSLNLASSHLTGSIPPELGELTNLTSLSLRANDLGGAIPEEIGRLSLLQRLYLDENDLTGCIPESVAKLGNSIGAEYVVNPQQRWDLVVCSEGGCAISSLAVGGDQRLAGDCTRLLEAREILDPSGLQLNWSANRPMADWNGIETSDGRVSSLSLASINLGGSIPIALGALSNLTSLNLQDNALTGSIPTAITSIVSLEELYLGKNALTGAIPPELGNLTNLTWLNLQDNALTGPIPSQIVSLSPLRGLYLNGNRFTGSIPANLWNLSNLTSLDLGDNALEGSIPAALTYLSRLEGLHLGGNKLTGSIPPELGGLTNLIWLDLRDNELTGTVPTEITTLPQLRGLYLEGNRFSGSIPTELGNFTNLEELRLGDNGFTGEIPVALGTLSGLKRLLLDHNNLVGSIPAELANLTHLEELRIDHNDLSGVIPTELGSLSNLKRLHLHGNNIEGPIPTEIGDLPALERLHLGDNKLTGLIPVELGRLNSLLALSLGSNDLTGPIPATLGGLSGLATLELQRNGLTGTVPTALGHLSSLRRLYFHDNKLTGCILQNVAQIGERIGAGYIPNPQEGGDLPDCNHTAVLSLSQLELYEGTEATYEVALSASPPEDVTVEIKATGTENTVTVQPTSLLFTAQNWDAPQAVTVRAAQDDDSNDESAVLEHHLLGVDPVSLPVSIRDVTRFTCTGTSPAISEDSRLVRDCSALLKTQEALDPASRSLNWSIDRAMTSWSGVGIADGQVTRLDLHDRGLVGTIPAEFGKLENLTHLDLGENGFTGAIPAALSSLTHLAWLGLSNNSLTDSIPSELGSLANLTVLGLSGNKLKGAIPAEIGNLNNLDELYLSGNEVTGAIPPELGDLKNLTVLGLSDNKLTGSIPAEIGGLLRLRGLYLNENDLTGCIPENVARLGSRMGTGYVPNPQRWRRELSDCEHTAVLSVSELEIKEGAEATYQVALSADPFADVTVQIKITGAEDAVTVDSTSLLFSVQNWDSLRTITVYATEDDDHNDEEAVLEHHVPGIDPILLSVKVVDGVESSSESSTVPRAFTLWGNYPNPFNASTRIAFALPEPAMVHVEITDLLGRRVQTLPARFIGAGTHQTIVLDASELSSATYLYRLVAVYEGGEEHVRYGRMLLVK